MAVEGKTILQTTERTELTGKEGIPFQEGTQNGHVLVERLKEYVGEGLVKEDGLKTINGEKLTGIGDITFESDAGKPVILRYPKYNETSDDSTILEKANSGEWFCTLPQMLENYNGGNLKAPFIGVQDDTNENFSPVTCYRIYSASNYYFMLYFLESNNNMEIQFRGFRMKYDPQDLTKWTGVFDNGTVRLSLASASNDGLMSKEDKAKVDGIRFSEDENSVLFNGKKYGVHVFKNLQRLSTSSSSDDVKKALNIDSPQDLESLISKGLNFVSVDTESTDKNLCPCSVRYAAPNIISITYCSAYSSNILTVHISVLSGSSSSFRVDGIEDPINSIPSVNNTLTSTSASEALSASMGKKLQDEKLAKEDVVDNLTTDEASKALSAAQGKALNDKIAEISNPASAEKDGLMSKEDKETFDNIKDGGAIEYKEISGQTVDADDLIVPKLTVRYLNKNASTAGNISNIPARGGFVLESMCVRYVDKDNCGYIQRWVSQATDDNLLPYSYIRQYADGEWTEWRKEVDTYISVNEPFQKVGLYFNTSGFQVGNVSNSSVVKNGSFVISMGYTALHLTGIKNSTTYKVVSNASVGYWMMKTCPQQFFHAGKVAVSEDKTSESAETKKQYVAEVVSVNAEEETVTFSKTLNPYTDFNDYSAKFYAYVDKASFSLEAGTTFNYSISGTECVAGGDESGNCVAIGARCVSIEDNSVALCWQTVALNFAETALGISNKSHKGDSADKQTLFSIGNGTQYFNDWGTAKQKNAMEVMKNGDVYIEGVGGYDGINDGFTAQSVQDVISGLLSEVSALKEEIEALKGSGA